MERKMTQQAGNVRVRRTQTLLREALIALIEERGFEGLTVAELTKRAMISRAAFYRNYQDKYDLVEQIFADAMNDVLAAIDDLGREHHADTWVSFFEHIVQYERLYRALLGKNGSAWFVRTMRARLSDLVMELGHLPHGPNASRHPVHSFSDDFVPDLVSTLLVEAVSWWLEQGRPYTPQEMARRTSLLTAALFKEANTWPE
jgi:AcrR family transcriptional regulator